MLHHKAIEDIKTITEKRLNGFPIPIMLTGEPGTGKSMLLKQLSEHKKIDYGYLSCNGQTSKSDIMGFIDGMGKKRHSMFFEYYTKGGVFVLEEIDTIHADLIVVINTMIDSDNGSFLNEIYPRHKDFYLCATSNTYSGATDEFSARKLLDQSTLERFIKLTIDRDDELEKKLLGDEYETVKWVREELKCKKFSMRNALMFVQMKPLGLKKALLATAFRNKPEEIDYGATRHSLEQFTKGYNDIEYLKTLTTITEEKARKYKDENSDIIFN